MQANNSHTRHLFASERPAETAHDKAKPLGQLAAVLLFLPYSCTHNTAVQPDTGTQSSSSESSIGTVVAAAASSVAAAAIASASTAAVATAFQFRISISNFKFVQLYF